MSDGAVQVRAGRMEAIFDLSRGRQALLSVVQPAIAAVAALGGLPSARIMMLGLVAATTGFLAVFSLNDVLDRHADREALAMGIAASEGYDLDVAYVRHPIARGDLPVPMAVAWVVCLSAVSVVAAWQISPLCLGFFAAAVVLEVAYCGLRRVTWAKTFVSGWMVGVGGLAGWVAVAPLSARAVSVFAFLALWEMAGRNLPNDLADLPADTATGLATVATTFGPAVSARATLAGAAATIATLAFLPAPLPVRLLAVAAGLAVMGVPALGLARSPGRERAGAYFNMASLLPVFVFAAQLAGPALIR